MSGKAKEDINALIDEAKPYLSNVGVGMNVPSLREMYAAYRNPDGTYNGVKALADISGLSERQVLAEWDNARKKKQK